MTLTSHELQPHILAACATAHLRSLPEHRWTPRAQLLPLVADAVDFLMNRRGEWHGLVALDLVRRYPATLAREFMRMLRDFLRWLAPGVDEDGDGPAASVEDEPGFEAAGAAGDGPKQRSAARAQGDAPAPGHCGRVRTMPDQPSTCVGSLATELRVAHRRMHARQGPRPNAHRDAAVAPLGVQHRSDRRARGAGHTARARVCSYRAAQPHRGEGAGTLPASAPGGAGRQR